jgi:hypothetical protein
MVADQALAKVLLDEDFEAVHAMWLPKIGDEHIAKLMLIIGS